MIAALLGSALMLTALSGCGQNTDGGNAVQKNEITAEAGNTGKDELVFVNYRYPRPKPSIICRRNVCPEYSL